MLEYIKCNIYSIVLHAIGNKNEDEGIIFSKRKLLIEKPETRVALLQYFLLSFKTNVFYNFFHETDLCLNEVYTYIKKIFENPEELYGQSIALAKHLYEQSTHPKIKRGEFYTVYFKDCILDGMVLDAVGLFKSENKDIFLKVNSSKEGFDVDSEKGININKLDKGCLIFNTQQEKGFIICIVDSMNKGIETKYWVEDFLHIRQQKDSFYNTENVLAMCKKFVTQKLSQQYTLSKVEQSALLNRSLKNLEGQKEVELNDYIKNVFVKPEFIDQFNEYKKLYKEESDVDISNSFIVSHSAIKKQGKNFKKAIKLDKNFDIYIHGDEKYIQKGVDEETGLHYYKFLFREEN